MTLSDQIAALKLPPHAEFLYNDLSKLAFEAGFLTAQIEALKLTVYQEREDDNAKALAAAAG